MTQDYTNIITDKKILDFTHNKDEIIISFENEKRKVLLKAYGDDNWMFRHLYNT